MRCPTRLATLPLCLALAFAAVPAVAVRTDAPAILLAETYRANLDPAPYWVSEKLDGIRAVWDGKVLRFRSGNLVDAPAWFTAALPDTPLDGELWLGRGSFERLSGIVRKQVPDDAEWHQVRYMIYELPGGSGSFSDRVLRMRTVVARAAVPWLVAVEQFRVANPVTLKTRLDEVVKAGGEGLMLHLADAPYLAGRNPALLKFKPFDDAEAKVVAHLPGKGRNAGRLGALLVETPDGKRFRIGSGFSDAEREAPPAIGSTVTFRYRSRTADGVPRFATYLRPHDEP